MPDTIATTSLAGATVEIIGVESGIGARLPGCGGGPAALRADGLEGWLRTLGLDTAWCASITAGAAAPDGASALETVAGICQILVGEVQRVLDRQSRVVVLGGDHSCAVGTWSGVARHLRRGGPLGLVWIDAHMDSHVPQTSQSGTLHGMPLACLLGHGEERLTGLAGGAPAVAPQNVCLLGVRSFERQERELLRRLGVRVIHMDEVAARGVDAALDEAFEIAGGETAGIGLSIDLDAVDPADAPGVGSPEPGGIPAAALTGALARASRTNRLVAVEIAEYNPELDRGRTTARLVRGLLAATLAMEQRHG